MKFLLKSQKIVIIGNAGSGKTTLALNLHKKLNIPVYHLDNYYWLPGWQRENFQKFSENHARFCAQDSWVIEGPYLKLLPERAAHADVIIFLDMPRYFCIWYVLKRSIQYWGRVCPGNPVGCPQQIASRKFLEFIAWTWNFNTKHHANIMRVLDEIKEKKPIYVVKSRKDLRKVIEKLCQ